MPDTISFKNGQQGTQMRLNWSRHSECQGSGVGAKPGGLGLLISCRIVNEASGSLQLRQVGSRVEARHRRSRAVVEAGS